MTGGFQREGQDQHDYRTTELPEASQRGSCQLQTRRSRGPHDLFLFPRRRPFESNCDVMRQDAQKLAV